MPPTQPGPAQPVPHLGRLSLAALGLALLLLLCVVGSHAAGALLDFLISIRNPLELDYGEGIVWQQLLLMPGPRAYATSVDLPFIVFHYPPAYYALTHAMMLLVPEPLMAGRIVSSLSTILLVPLVALLVLQGTPRAYLDRWTTAAILAVAISAGLLPLCLNAVRSWGPLMRVDMPGYAFGLAGLLLGARAKGRWLGTTLALLLCAAAVFTKQTLLSAGVAVFLVAVIQRPRGAIAAALTVGAIGLGVVLELEWATGGGFLLHIVSYNINRLELRRAYWLLVAERSSLPVMGLMGLAALWLARDAIREGRWRLSLRESLQAMRQASDEHLCQHLVLLHFAFASLFLFTLLKAGGNVNYFIEWMCTGTVLVGIALANLVASGNGRTAILATAVLGLVVAPRPLQSARSPDSKAAAQATELIQRIAAADKPIWSVNMSLLMRAGKPVIAEPSIVTELSNVGRWDERPLIDMVRSHGFAFMIVIDDVHGGGDTRTAGLDAAMRAAYPHVERIGPAIRLRTPD